MHHFYDLVPSGTHALVILFSFGPLQHRERLTPHLHWGVGITQCQFYLNHRQALGTSDITCATSKCHVLYTVAYMQLPSFVQSLDQTSFPLRKTLFLLRLTGLHLTGKQSLLTEFKKSIWCTYRANYYEFCKERRRREITVFWGRSRYLGKKPQLTEQMKQFQSLEVYFQHNWIILSSTRISTYPANSRHLTITLVKMPFSSLVAA